MFLGVVGTLHAEDWPQWRGPTGQGTSRDKGLPTRWQAGSANIRWRTPIPGEGASSPVVSNGRVYLTTAYPGEQRHPYDTAAAGLALALAAGAAGVLIVQLVKVFRGARLSSLAEAPVDGSARLESLAPRERWSWPIALLVHTIIVVALGTVILVKPGWFWRMCDPWSGHMRSAELAVVETLMLRPVFLAYAGSLIYIFTALTVRAGRQMAIASADAGSVARMTADLANQRAARAAHILAWWMRFLTAICTLAVIVASVLVVCRRDWFWGTGQPWLAWLVSGSLGVFALAAGVGWLAEAGWTRLIGAALGLTVAGWLCWNTPLNETNESFLIDLRVGYVLPACVLLVGHALVGRMARRPGWPAGQPTSWFLPLLLAALGLTLFVHSNYLQPASGTVRALLSVDEQSGDILWQTTVCVSPAERKHALNSFATATPASDGEHVYADFGVSLAALDRAGNILWQIDDPDYPQFLRYGAGSSPVLAGDLLIVYRDREWQGHGEWGHDSAAWDLQRRPSSLTAYDKLTGKIRWQVTPSFAHDSYMTPLIWQHAGRAEVVISTWQTLAGFDLATGELQWQQPHKMQQIVPSLVAGDDWLITGGGNVLPYQLAAVKPPGQGQPGETLWTSKRGGPGIASPVCVNGLLFSVSDVGVLYCREAATGKELWRQRLEGKFLASLAAGGDHVYALNTEGTMFVTPATATLAEPMPNRLGEPCVASPALANGSVFVRGARHLVRIDGGD
jgi:outer membrane protein assembly factor BamB